jgi:hypothetical protein
MRTSTVIKTILATAALAIPLASNAESNFQTGAGALTATAHVDFQITIPQILYLRVGTGTSYTTGVLSPNNTTVDLISFVPTSSQLVTGGAVAGTGGDVAGNNGTETAAIIGNGGTVTLNATAGGALSDGAGDTINYTQISTATATNTTTTILPAPTLANGASNTVTLTPASGKAVFEDAKWTYTYNIVPTAIPAPGTYGGINVNNSRVVYTASMP